MHFFFHKTFLEFFPTLHWHKHLLRISHKRPSTYKPMSKLPDDSSETAGTFTLFNSKQPPSLQGKHVLGLPLSNSPHQRNIPGGTQKSPRKQHHDVAIRLESACAAGPLAEMHISHYLSFRQFILDLRNDLVKSASVLTSPCVLKKKQCQKIPICLQCETILCSSPIGSREKCLNFSLYEF